MQTIETRMSDISRRVDAISQSGVGQSASRLSDEMRSLRGDVEKLRYDLDANQRRTQQLFSDLDARVQRLEGGAPLPNAAGAAAPVGGAVTPPAVGGSSIARAPASNSQEEQRAYLAAFDLLKAGKYDDAILGFQNMVSNWPNGQYTDNGLYWIGEAYYVKRDYNAALKNFQDLLTRFPNSSKAADAMLKVGFAQQELKQVNEARATLQKLVQQYPSSSAANLARQRLQQLPEPG